MPELTTSLHLGEHTSAADLVSLEAEWHGLWRRCPRATPFQSPAWLIPWWRQFGPGRPWVLACHADGRLVGLVPLYLAAEEAGTVIRLMGAGNSDYLDGLFAPGFETAAAAAALAHLQRCRDRWDRCDLFQLPPHSPLARVPAPPRLDSESGEAEPCPVLDLPGTLDELRPWFRSRLAEHLRQGWNRARRLGRTEVVRADAAKFGELFDAAVRLHGARWSAQGLPGTVAETSVRDFLRDAAGRLLDADALRLYVLRVDGSDAAALLGFHCHGRTYYYLGGFDPKFARLSPGALIVEHAIGEAIAQGATAFDFLRGREPYKYKWGAADRPTCRRLLRPA